ncbi:MAG TPA: winged helix-turn-helix domain-containing protein [Pyrinomonadaceae bacterium]|nr:winged helix-turn-helix domain-containing protein [Pyrinomonadaceae bacterium]
MDRLRKRYLLNGYTLVPDERLLSNDGQPVHLPKRPFEVLLFLVENRDRFVSRAELLDRFWDGKDVYDDALRKCVGAIRKALEEQPDRPRFIETRWGVGYRYIGPLQEQIVPHETSITEIERTRGVRIVFEDEEETHDAPHSVAAPSLNPPRHRAKAKVIALALSVLAIGVALVTIMASRRSRANDNSRTPIHSIAVLPLRNLTGNAANDYLSDGLTESLITTLSKERDLTVISRGSAFSLKGKDLDPQEAGRLLKVAALLEGSLRQSGDKLRVNVRLVSTSNGQVVWASDSNDRQIGDIFAIQDEIARNLNAQLGLKPGGREQLAQRHTRNVEAYQSYLKARYSLNQRTPEGITRSIDYFQRAIALDPNYALAYAGLAEAYDKAYFFIELPPQETIAKEKAAATRALQLDDSLAEAHVAMATVYANTWGLANAAREEERAIEIDPLNVEAHHNYAYRLIDLGKPDQAIAEIKRAQELDPLNIVMNIDVGEILLFARHNDEAISALRHAIEMDPARANAHWDLGNAYEAKGMYAESVAEHLEEFRLKGESPETIGELRKAFESAGIKGFWRQRLAQLKARPGYLEPFLLVNIYVSLDDKDQVFAWLEKAYRDRNPFMVGLKSSPRSDILRSDPRYDDLLRRVGLS